MDFAAHFALYYLTWPPEYMFYYEIWACLGSTKVTGREPLSCLCCVFQLKLAFPVWPIRASSSKVVNFALVLSC